ncbi:hypothetical protein IU459_27200 [Nocardia amamiensis]|uniref:Uncharacterized protein n=1 Tax=Nocardia amamiensis TaxID=404578 RepID=A0ABS0CX92_9NOCA|nr:hypothetical protein [Nocardia amamiensis]MBF6301204.1 hypothetical protein [Nocardia amamiensis]
MTAQLGWIAAHSPAEDEMVRVTNATVAGHDEWDSPHYFTALAWDGTRVFATMVTVIDPGVRPQDYPPVLLEVMSKHLADRLRDKPGAAPVVACMLQVETFGLRTGPGGMIPEERAALHRGELHMLPHRTEAVIVMTADIAGRMWSAAKERGWDGGPDEVLADDIRCGEFPELARRCASLAPPMYVAAARSFWARGGGDLGG